MFSATLHRKLEASDMKGQVLSVCAHPGFSITDMTGALGAVVSTCLVCFPYTARRDATMTLWHCGTVVVVRV